jgi:pyruvate/2-oxoglutarate dehydrogenase complex dihydrolipoamide dehydrogenase (E3) component
MTSNARIATDATTGTSSTTNTDSTTTTSTGTNPAPNNNPTFNNTNNTITADAMIIGFGKGGKTLAAKLGASGQKVAVAEASSSMYGGTCINIGCLPSKSLILSAEQAQHTGESTAPETRAIAFKKAMAEKRRVTSMLRGKNYHKLADQENITVLTGRARFVSPGIVEVATNKETVRVQAAKIFINTGATARIPDIPGIATTPGVYTSTGIMELDEIPQRLVIIGSGFIGLEFASMFADFGASVTVLQHNGDFLPHEDADMAAAIRKQLEAQGVRFLFNASTREIATAPDGDGVRMSVTLKATEPAQASAKARASYKVEAGSQTETNAEAPNNPSLKTPATPPTAHKTLNTEVDAKSCDNGNAMHPGTPTGDAEVRLCLTTDAVLVATGRKPNVEDLNLEAADVDLTDRGAVKVDELLRTTAENIWALGDVNGGPQHTYISLDDYRVVWSQLNGSKHPYTLNERRNVPSSTFLHTPYSRVGMNEREAQAAKIDYVVKRLPVAAVPKAQVMREPEGFMKAIVDARNGRILGAMLLSTQSYEVINIVKLAMDFNTTAEMLRDTIFTHPTIAEALNDLFA